MSLSIKLPAVLQRPNVPGGSLSVERVLKQAIDLLRLVDSGTPIDSVDTGDVDVIVGNLEILKASIHADGEDTYPIHHGKWIVQFSEAVFVVFDPTTDGAHAISAGSTLQEAEHMLTLTTQL